MNSRKAINLPPGVPPLNVIYLYPTDRCNLHCQHCWVAPQQIKNIEEYIAKIKGKEVSIDLIKDTIVKAKDIGLSSVKLTGGEPLLRPDVPDLMKWLHENNINMTIETNGTLIDEKMAKLLKDVNMRHIAISLDGPNAKTHDMLRDQPGAFDATVEGIKNCKKYGLNVQIIMSLYTDNEHLIEDTLRLAIELKTNSFKINPVIPSGRALLVQKESRTIPVDRLIKLYHYTLELSKKYRHRIFFSIPTALKRFDDLINNSAECHIHTICGVMGNGDISICGIGRTEPELVMGNIKTDDIRDIWINGKIFKKIREDIPAKLKGICSNCIFKAKCLGACVAISYSLSRDITSGYWFCEEANRLGLFPESRKIKQDLVNTYK